jgi:hypothetical protein
MTSGSVEVSNSHFTAGVSDDQGEASGISSDRISMDVLSETVRDRYASSSSAAERLRDCLANDHSLVVKAVV